MSVVVRKAVEADIESVCDLLHGHMSAKFSRETWRRLLDYPWRPPDADRGCVAVAGDQVVGFLGLVYADRPFDGRDRRFCNICAWYLRKDYRGRGIGREIQRQSVADPAATYTIMTATTATGRAFERDSGFSILDDERFILAPTSGDGGAIEVVEDPVRVEAELNSGELRIFRDHQRYNLRHLMCRRGSESAYLIMQVKMKGDDIRYHEVMHVDNPPFLADYGPALAAAILKTGNSVLAIDRRFVPGGVRWPTEKIELPRWYRSDLAPGRIDHLYNEIVLLDLKL